MSSAVTISGRRRNSLFKPALDLLSVADDAYHAAVHRLHEEAQRRRS